MAATLTLLCEAATRNAVMALNPIPHQRRGRVRGLESLPLAHLSYEYPTLEPTTVGMGRTRSRNSGPYLCSDSLCVSLTCGPDVYIHPGIFLTPH